VLVAGVNGTGKTTSTAKLAHWLKQNGTDVMLAAADTFRAAAIEQLDEWAGRIGVPIVKGNYKADPSSVCHDAYDAARSRGCGVLLCDTAGRLHTRHNLMEELGKIRRVLARKHPDAPQERLLVIDATTGSNALQQAREFHKALDLTGLIITKLDGSGKGGIAVAIARELGIPPRFIGTGEKLGDLEPFDRRRYVETLL
jgi:fused signal recognition particle receptor